MYIYILYVNKLCPKYYPSMAQEIWDNSCVAIPNVCEFSLPNIMLNTGHVYIHIVIILIHLNLEQQHLTLEKSTCHLFRRYLLCACVWLSLCLCAIVRSKLNFTQNSFHHFWALSGIEWYILSLLHAFQIMACKDEMFQQRTRELLEDLCWFVGVELYIFVEMKKVLCHSCVMYHMGYHLWIAYQMTYNLCSMSIHCVLIYSRGNNWMLSECLSSRWICACSYSCPCACVDV